MKFFLPFLFLLSFSSASLAEPTKTPKYLMSQPISLMDWGIHKLDQLMNSFSDLDRGYFYTRYIRGGASYSFDENRIILSGQFEGKGTDEECLNNIVLLKKALTNFVDNEDIQRKVAEDMLSRKFSHEAGYVSKNRPDDIGNQLVKITEIKVQIMKKTYKEIRVNSITCKTDFKSSDISIVYEEISE